MPYPEWGASIEMIRTWWWRNLMPTAITQSLPRMYINNGMNQLLLNENYNAWTFSRTMTMNLWLPSTRAFHWIRWCPTRYLRAPIKCKKHRGKFIRAFFLKMEIWVQYLCIVSFRLVCGRESWSSRRCPYPRLLISSCLCIFMLSGAESSYLIL